MSGPRTVEITRAGRRYQVLVQDGTAVQVEEIDHAGRRVNVWPAKRIARGSTLARLLREAEATLREAPAPHTPGRVARLQLLQDALERWKAFGRARQASEAERAHAAVMVDTAQEMLREMGAEDMRALGAANPPPIG